jgi:hypothetical protein
VEGTVIVALLSPFGGQLVLRHGSFELVLYWSTAGRVHHPDDLHWVFFYSDIEHEVGPVTSSNRFTVSYNIYGCHKPESVMTTKIARTRRMKTRRNVRQTKPWWQKAETNLFRFA